MRRHAIGEVNVVKHPSQVFFRNERVMRGLRTVLAFEQSEIDRKLAHAETRHLKALPFTSTAIKDIEMLAFSVSGFSFVGKNEMCFDHISDVFKKRRGPLLTIHIDITRQSFERVVLHARTR